MKNKLLAAAAFGLVAFFAVSCMSEADIGDVGGDGSAQVKKVQPEAHGVEVTPSTISLFPGEAQVFAAKLSSYNRDIDIENADQTVDSDGQLQAEYEWSITMKTDTHGTVVTEDGIITLGYDEKGPVVLKAAAKHNKALWGTAVITVKKGGLPKPPPVYTVKFDITDGTSGEIEPVQVGEGDSVASVVGKTWIEPLNSNDAGRGNVFYFDSWNTQADESGSLWSISDPVTANIKVYAIWKVLAADKSAIRFNTSGQTVDVAPQTMLVNRGTSVAASGQKLPQPTSAISDFFGWFQDRETLAVAFGENSIVNDAEKTVYAKWTAKQFNIEFVTNGGNEIPAITAEVNTHLANLTTPVKGTSVFEGWFRDNGTFLEPWQNSDVVESDITLYAKWRDLYTYTVTFHSNGGSEVSNRMIDSGSRLTSPADPARAGWTFGGWFTDNNTFAKEWDFNTKITKDEDLYARWFDTNANIRKVVYNTNGAKEPITDRTVELDALLTTPQDPQRDGFKFVAWYKDDVTFVNQWRFASDKVKDNMTLHAKWEPVITYKVSFQTNGGLPAIQEHTVGEGELIEFPGLIGRDKSSFAGWYSDAVFAKAWDFTKDTVNEDTVLYAKWTHTVIFNSNGGTNINSLSGISAGSKILLPNNPSKNAADFHKWYKDASFTNEWDFNNETVNENITLFARWKHTVMFNSNGGGEIPSQTVFTGDKVNQPAGTPAKDKATFDKWTKDASLTEEWDFALDKVSAHTTIYGRWIQKNLIHFNLNGATSAAIADKEVTTGEKIPSVTQPQKIDADFGGWYRDADLKLSWDFNDKVTAPMTLYAKWTHKVTFDAGEGVTSPEAKTVIDGEAVAAPSVTKDGASIEGWYAPDSNTKWNFATNKVTTGTAASPLVLTAKWTAASYIVRFSVDGGTNVPNQSVAHGGKVSSPPEVTKAGYDFINWYEDHSLSKLYDFDKAVTSDNLIIYAKWQIKEYTVTFHSNGGSAVTQQKVKHENLASEPEKPKKTGYGFVAWHVVESNFKTDTKWHFDVNKVKADTDLYAQWSTDSYTVSFDTDGGTAIADAHPSHNSTVNRPADPTKNGWTFTGRWFVGDTDKEWNFTNDKVTTDITLKAAYTVNSFTVRLYRNYNDNDEALIGSQTVNYEGTIGSRNDPARDGYTFTGWWTDKVDGEKWVLNRDKITSNINLYAQWTPKKYTVIFDVGSESNTFVNPSQTNQEMDTTVVLPTGSNITRTGYIFGGWYESSTFSGNALTSYKMPFNGARLYAKWTVGTYAITTAITGEGVITVDESAEYGRAVSVTVTPGSDYKLKEGTLKANGIEIIGSSFEMPGAPVTITVEFISTKVTITFDKNGGSSDANPNTINITRDSTISNDSKSLPAGPGVPATGNNKYLKEWNTKADGKGVTFTEDTIATENQTVYAIWVASPASADRTSMATGGTLSYVMSNSTWYEVHTFANRAAAGEEFKFTRLPSTVDVIVVGGGGGGGSSNNNGLPAGGGGAGEVIHHPSYTMALDTNYLVMIGAGGAGGDKTYTSHGSNGSETTVKKGDEVLFKAVGGGGGSQHGGNNGSGGEKGGSSGGAACGTAQDITKGTMPSGATSYGNKGGSADVYQGAGGGGAGGAAGSLTAGKGSTTAGGAGIALNGVTYAKGGNGGVANPATGAANTGNGGGGGLGSNGASGGSGVVVFRFVYK